MNKTEREMVGILRPGRDEFGYVGVEAEFKAKGERDDSSHHRGQQRRWRSAGTAACRSRRGVGLSRETRAWTS